MTKTLSILITTLLLLTSCGGSRTDDAASTSVTGKPAGPTGKIRGVVVFKGDAPAARFEPIAENQNVCGDKVAVSRLAVGKDKGVQNAFIYLDGVQTSEKFVPRQSLLVDQKDCQYKPHSLVVPAGGKIDITNSDPILHNVHAHQFTDQGQTTLFNIAQPVKGQRTSVDTPQKSGIVYLTCEAGHPWMSGYVFVANHPYVTTTDTDGGFVIEGVPPGKYTIKMWHEGVILKQNIKSLQRYEYEEPYETTQEVTVEANGETVVNFELALRSGA